MSMKFAYADPPYIGMARQHYQCAEIDHEELISRLCSDYDAWALSLSSPTLKGILSLCPDDVRVMPWVKPFCSFKPNVNPAFAWEPVITRGGRKLGRDVPTMRDWVSAGITLERGTHGAKPDEFCFWLFAVMGLTSDDEFHDLYFGSGAVTRAWNLWGKMARLPMTYEPYKPTEILWEENVCPSCGQAIMSNEHRCPDDMPEDDSWSGGFAPNH